MILNNLSKQGFRRRRAYSSSRTRITNRNSRSRRCYQYVQYLAYELQLIIWLYSDLNITTYTKLSSGSCQKNSPFRTILLSFLSFRLEAKARVWCLGSKRRESSIQKIFMEHARCCIQDFSRPMTSEKRLRRLSNDRQGQHKLAIPRDFFFET